MAFIKTMWGTVINADCYERFCVLKGKEKNEDLTGYMVVGYLRGQEPKGSRNVLGIYQHREAAEQVLADIAEGLDTVRMEEDGQFDIMRMSLGLEKDREKLEISKQDAFEIGRLYESSYVYELVRKFIRGELNDGRMPGRKAMEIVEKLGILEWSEDTEEMNEPF